MFKHINETAAYIKEKINTNPKIAIVLGSGLGNLIDHIDIEQRLPYSQIPNFPVSTVEGHSGTLITGKLSGKDILAMQGRFHYYEGYDMKQVTFPIRVMKAMGIETLILSNAAGGMNPEFKVGDLMLITDHINLFPEHPLRGHNDGRLGIRFPNMGKAYDPELLDMVRNIAKSQSIPLQEGVYVGTTGPTYETPAEYRYFRRIGGDAVGMSTVPEVIVAVHAGMKVLALSVITDLGGMDLIQESNHEDVQKSAQKVQPLMTEIIKRTIKQL